MDAIVFYPGSGNQAGEFDRESKEACAYFRCERVSFDGRNPVRAKEQVLAALKTFVVAKVKLKYVLFLCHGWRVKIQAGFDLESAGELAKAIAAVSAPDVRVGLYCCSTGNGPGIDHDGQGDGTGPGEGSFADDLRDGLVAEKCEGGQMFAHTTAGHLSMNPDARLFEIGREKNGGLDIAPIFPKPPAGRRWTKIENDAFRLRYRKWRGVLHLPFGRWQILGMDWLQINRLIDLTDPYFAMRKGD